MIVLVAQMGAVGSKTVILSLQGVGFERRRVERWVDMDSQSDVCVHLHVPQRLARIVSACRKAGAIERLVVISLVRELIGRNLSAYFKNATKNPERPWYFGNREEFESAPIHALTQDFRAKNISQGAFFGTWPGRFGRALGASIDPFDVGRGLSVWDVDGLRVLLCQTERMQDNWGAIGDFVGRPGMEMVRGNIGDDLWYGDLYKRFKARYKPSPKEISACYETPLMQQFYSEADRTALLARWGC